MGYELLNRVAGILTAAGIRAGEEYPAGAQVEILSPVAAVGLRALDPAAGEVRFTVRVLSPRLLGGWCCQVNAAKAVAALHEAGLRVQTEPMEYLGGSDCFCVALTAAMDVKEDGLPEQAWEIFCGDVLQSGVKSFRAVCRQGRRIVGAFCQSEPVRVTPGTGGWELELVQHLDTEPGAPAEPFVLTIREQGREIRFTGCCWNEILWEHSQSGAVLTRRGFALGREVTDGE